MALRVGPTGSLETVAGFLGAVSRDVVTGMRRGCRRATFCVSVVCWVLSLFAVPVWSYALRRVLARVVWGGGSNTLSASSVCQLCSGFSLSWWLFLWGRAWGQLRACFCRDGFFHWDGLLLGAPPFPSTRLSSDPILYGRETLGLLFGLYHKATHSEWFRRRKVGPKGRLLFG